MNVEYFSFPAQMRKSGEEQKGRIPIEIVPSGPAFDRQNDKIVLKAFDKNCINSFLYDGVLDYDHQSLLGKTTLEKAQAIIGEPEKLYIDKEKNIPVCEGFLFKGNPFVDNVIIPALNANSTVLGASLGGKILKKSTVIDPITKSKKNVISKIALKHIAITPLQRAVNQDTSIKLRKSSNGFEFSFPTFNGFIKSFTDTEDIEKALQAGSETNIVNLAGGQALQKQSLEGNKKKKKKKKELNDIKIKSALPFILDNIVNGLIKGSYNEYYDYLTQKGFNHNEADETIKLLASRSVDIAKLTF